MTKYEDEKGKPRAEQPNHGRISREEFFKGLIHEFTNMLTAVIGIANWLLRRRTFAPGRELAGKDSQSHEGALFDGSEVDHSESKIGDE